MVKTTRTLLSAAVVLVICPAVFVLKNGADALLPGEGPEESPGHILGEHRYPVHCVAFAPDGKTVAAGGGFNELAGEVRLWDPATGKERARLEAHSKVIFALAFVPQGKTLATASLRRVVKLWEVPTGCEQLSIELPIAVAPSLAISPDGRTLAFGGWERDAQLKLWSLASSAECALVAGSGPVAFSPDGQRLASAGQFGEWATVKIWDPATGQELFALRGHRDPVWSIAFSPDGRMVASASADKSVRLWDAASGRELATLRGHTGQVYTVAFAPDGETVASGSDDQTVRVWNLAMGREQITLRGHTGRVTSVAFSPDGQWIASGSHDKTVRLWPLAKKPKMAAADEPAESRQTMTRHGTSCY